MSTKMQARKDMNPTANKELRNREIRHKANEIKVSLQTPAPDHPFGVINIPFFQIYIFLYPIKVLFILFSR